MSGVYWGLTALYLVGHLEDMDEEEIVNWVLASQHADGGFGGSPRHDSHLLYTLSALQVLALYQKLHLVDADKVISCESFHAQPLGYVAAHAGPPYALLLEQMMVPLRAEPGMDAHADMHAGFRPSLEEHGVLWTQQICKLDMSIS